MSTHKHFDRICVAAILLSLLLTIFLMTGVVPTTSGASTLGYEERLFAIDRVHTIDITIDDWDSFLQKCQSEEYSLCSVTIDGETISSVGIRGKGNTSLSTVASMDSDRYSFKIEFDQYDDSMSYYGLDKLCLNNIIQDNTYMKDYLTYQMMRQFSVSAPLCSYAYITVNGEDWGLYLAVEGVEDAFLQRNYGSDYGELYKPDSMNMGGGRGNGKEFSMSQVELPQQDGQNQKDGREMSQGSSDVKLQYIDDAPDSYSNIFSSAKTDVTEEDQNRLIDSLRQLSSYENLREVVDVEQVLRYFVVHNFVVNGDSYTGSMIHNYYLYEEEGRLSMIPWDYNLAFGTFQGGSANSSVNADIDEVLEDRPMQAWIFSDEAYAQMYYDLYTQFLDEFDMEAMIEVTNHMIAPYVAVDPTAFCSYEAYETAVETLKEFCRLRKESVSRQLCGDTDPVETAGLNISDMGTMNHGMDGDRTSQMGDMAPPEGMQMPSMGEIAVPEGMQMPNMGEIAVPEGMQMPNMGEMVVPEQMPAMDNTDITQQFQKGRGERTDHTAPNGEGMAAPEGGFDQSHTQSNSMLLMLLMSFALLLVGLVVAWRYRK